MTTCPKCKAKQAQKTPYCPWCGRTATAQHGRTYSTGDEVFTFNGCQPCKGIVAYVDENECVIDITATGEPFYGDTPHLLSPMDRLIQLPEYVYLLA